MTDFFKELEKAAKHLDKIAKEWEPKKKSPKKTLKKRSEEQTATSEGVDVREYLPVSEVAEITKLQIDTYGHYLDDQWEGGVYTSSNPTVHTYFQVWFARKDEDGYNPEGVLSYF